MDNFSKYKFTLDYHSHKSQVSLPVLLGDTKTKLYITLTDGGTPCYIEDGCRAVFAATKSNGDTLFNNCIIENNSTIVYEFTEQTTNVSGIVKCEVRLYDLKGKTLTTPRFIMIVDQRVVYDNEVISKVETTALDEIIRSEQARVEEEAKRNKTFDEKTLAWEHSEEAALVAVSNAEKWATGSEVETDLQHNNSAKDWAMSLKTMGNQVGGYPVLEKVEGEAYPKIPSVYLNQVDIKEYKKIYDESELNTIDAQVGDVAILVTREKEYDEEGKPTDAGEFIISKSWLLYSADEYGSREWIKFGLSYATNSGYATYANNAGDASKVNGLVIKSLSEQAYEDLTDKEEGIYFVTIEGE